MENVSSKSNVSSGLSVSIMDFTKNITPNVDTKGSGFKDYVNNKNVEKKDTKFEARKDFRKNTPKNDSKDKFDNKDKDVKEVQTKEPKKIDDNKEKITGNKEIKENTTDEVKNTQDKDNNSLKVEDKTLDEKVTESPEVVKENNQEVNMVPENLQNLLATILNKVDKPDELVENFENLNPQQVKQLIDELNNQKDMPQELKTEILNVLGKLDKKQNIDKNIFGNLLNKNSKAFAELLNFGTQKDINIKTIKDIVKELILDSKVKENDIKVNLGQEIKELKGNLNINQNESKNLNQLNNLDNIEENENFNTNILPSENITNIKIFNNNAKIFNAGNRGTLSSQNIQNFSKVVDEMRMAIKDDKTTISIKLEPQTLGKLSIKINSENGILNASFFVESDKAKQAIENDLQNLRQALSDQGMDIQDINVQVGQNNEDLNYHQNIMQAINFSKRGMGKIEDIDQDDFNGLINPYISEDLFNDLI